MLSSTPYAARRLERCCEWHAHSLRAHRALEVVPARAGHLLALLQVHDVKHAHQIHVVRQARLVARGAPRALDRVVVLQRREMTLSAQPFASAARLVGVHEHAVVHDVSQLEQRLVDSPLGSLLVSLEEID